MVTVKDLAPVYLSVFIDTIGLAFSIPTLVYFVTSEEGLNGNAFELGLSISCYSGAAILGSLILGPLSDKYGRRPAIMISIISSSLTFFIQGFVASVWQLIVCRAVSGLCGSSTPVAQAYIADCTTKEERPKFIGLIGAAVGIGFTVGPGLGALVEVILEAAGLNQALRFQIAFIIAGTFSLIAAVWAWVKLKEPSEAGWLKDNESGSDVAPAPTNCTAVAVVALASSCCAYSTTVMQSLWGLTVEEFWGWGTVELGMALLLAGFVIGGVQGFLKKVVDKVGVHGTCVVAGILIGGGMLGFDLQNVFAHLMCYTVHVIGFGFQNSCFSVLVSQYTSKNAQGTGQGYLASAGNAARVVAPLLSGVLYDMSFEDQYSGTFLDNGNLPYFVGSMVAFVGSALVVGMLVCKRQYPKSAESAAGDTAATESATELVPDAAAGAGKPGAAEATEKGTETQQSAQHEIQVDKPDTHEQEVATVTTTQEEASQPEEGTLEVVEV